MTEECAGLNQIEGLCWKRLGHGVVLPDLEIVVLERVQESSVDVSGNDTPLGADALAQPLSNGSTTCPDAQTSPTGTHAYPLEVSDGRRVLHLLE